MSFLKSNLKYFLRSTHHASCSSWCRFVPISLTGGVTFAAVSRDRTGRYLQDSSVRRGSFPGLGPPGPCSFSLSHQKYLNCSCFRISKHRERRELPPLGAQTHGLLLAPKVELSNKVVYQDHMCLHFPLHDSHVIMLPSHPEPEPQICLPNE